MLGRTTTGGAIATLLLLALTVPAASGATRAARPSDFNGDGYADLAIGAKQSEAGDDAGGTVNVIYGSSGGLAAAGDQLWSQDSPGVKGVASGWDDAEDETWSPGDEFGAALASGDFDRDGFADLAIGAPSDGETGVRRGAVNVLYGASTGLTAAGDQLWTRNNIPGQADVPGSLGAVLEAADFNGDGFADLAIATFDATGAVRLLFGSAGGLTTIGSLLLTTGSPLVPDSVTDGWFFGQSLASGDIDGDDRAELAIGSGFADVGGLINPGAVVLLYGDEGGFRTDATELWTRDTPGVPGSDAEGTQFGYAVAMGDLNADGFDDLVASAPFDPHGGTVTALYGSGAGLQTVGSQVWHQDVAGVPGVGEDDWFGSALAVGRFDMDPGEDLAIAAQEESLGDTQRAGAVTVLYGSLAGLTAADAQLWTQNSGGVAGVARAYEQFGYSLAVGDYGLSPREDLAIGAPGFRSTAGSSSGEVNVLYGHLNGLTSGGSQRWTKDSPGIKGTASERDVFGAALSP